MIDSYDKMNIGVFREIKEILEDNTLNEFAKKVRILTIITDYSEEDILNMPINKLSILVEKMGFLGVMPKQKVAPSSIILNGVKYDIQYDIKNITAAQYIDFQTFIKDYDKYLVELASILIIPKGKKYNEGYDIVKVQNDIREYMSILDLYSVCFFFLMSYKGLMKSSLSYLIQRLKKMMRQEKDRVMKFKIGRAIIMLQQSMPINGLV